MKMFRTALSHVKAHRTAASAALLTGVTALVVSDSAMAVTTPYDLAPAGSSITDQVTAVLVVALPIAGGILALFIGWKILKRFVAA
jgi:uncharacterized membrane protein YqgA involved in biofilm formation